MQLSDLKIGDVVYTDDCFTCLKQGIPHTVYGGADGLFIRCDDGKHFLEGQEDDETGELIGISSEPA